MDIYATKGTKILFTGKGGYQGDNNYANEHLVVGETYTVHNTRVSEFSTVVILEEKPDLEFNSVTFDDITIGDIKGDINIKILAQNIANNPEDFDADTIEKYLIALRDLGTEEQKEDHVMNCVRDELLGDKHEVIYLYKQNNKVELWASETNGSPKRYLGRNLFK